jgi:hypothetical protein
LEVDTWGSSRHVWDFLSLPPQVIVKNSNPQKKTKYEILISKIKLFKNIIILFYFRAIYKNWLKWHKFKFCKQIFWLQLEILATSPLKKSWWYL